MTLTSWNSERIININSNNFNKPNYIIINFINNGQDKTLILYKNKNVFDVNIPNKEPYIGSDIIYVMNIITDYLELQNENTRMEFNIHQQNHVTLNLYCNNIIDGTYIETHIKIQLKSDNLNDIVYRIV